MSAPIASRREKICAYCGAVFLPKTRGKIAASQRCCSRQCAKDLTRRNVVKTCEVCGNEFSFRSSGKKNNAKRRFCSNQCAARWRMARPGRAAISVGPMRAAVRKKWATDEEYRSRMARNSSARMIMQNPMRSAKVRKKISVALSGRTFLSRGGNGQYTRPQIAIHELTGFPMEYAINTKPVRQRFQSVPKSYKVDLADPSAMLAIEIDGNSHRQRKWRFLDKRKTEILNALGWSVLRFSNKEVIANPALIVQKINSFTTSALKGTTTISPTAF